MENTNLFTTNNVFSQQFINYIHLDIDYIFPILNNTEKNLIKEMMISLLVLIYARFHFSDETQFFKQLSDNNNQDIRMILFLLFPYINDDNNFKIHKSIINLKDLSVKEKNEYKTNIQFDRYFNKNSDTYEYKYSIIDVYNNYITSYYTIHRCAHHLYCNWQQIIPLTLTNYKQSYIYTDTESIIPNHTSLKGLDIRDYYHAFINDMYLDILPYKWLIYEYYDEMNNKDIMYLEEIINYFDYPIFDIPSIENTIIFQNKWFVFIKNDQHDIVYNILLHFNVVAYQYLTDDQYNNIVKNNPLLKRNSNQIYELDETSIRNKEEYNSLLLQIYNKQEFGEPIYNFLVDTFNKFSYTWYGKMIFPKRKFGKKDIVYLKDQTFDSFKQPIYKNSYVSYKNIYNCIKSLLIIESTPYKIREWDGLSLDIQNTLLNRINTNSSDWFRISNNLKLKYNSGINTSSLTSAIFAQIRPMFKELVFHSLISRGILNEFKVKRSKDDVQKSFEGYYYLTQSKYNDLKTYLRSDKDTDLISYPNDVIKNLSKKQLFAMNWLQQIHFFKHFFNQRIMYVTGGTGTGKSTQVPKLLLYGLQLIGNYSGKVINTQPRINATTGNAERISDELGVPINTYDYIEKKNKQTDSFYVQYSTGNKKHDPLSINNNAAQVSSYLKIVTDGTLLQAVRDSPFLKSGRKENGEFVSEEHNMYDVISIDEAHEHNTNMDLLLTFLRDTVQMNNSLRLVIITATIDLDEPIYRRYYKYINDNLLYPLNNTLINIVFRDTNILNKIIKIYNIPSIDNLFLDRISLDRRIHIAPPLGSTNYEITEIYTPYPVLTYPEAEELGIKKAIEVTKTANGDILFFSVTEPAIDRIVTLLNNDSGISSKWIAIPYYRNVSTEWKNIVENINIKIGSIDVNKKDILLAIQDKEYRKVSPNTYDKAIIVTTNIAEASITINSLKYVIETGFVNTVSFDPVLEFTNIGPQYITETSRIQRKGRVGRVASGTVYYMYQKDSRKDNIPKYAITQSINTLINTLLDYVKEGYTLDTNQNEQIELPLLPNTLSSTLVNFILKDQYKDTPNNRDQFYSGIFDGNPLIHTIDVNNQKLFSLKYRTGYEIENIIDEKGIFYIVHPLETFFKRNVLTGEFENPDRKKSFYLTKFFSRLFNLRLIISNDNVFFKTRVYSIMDELKTSIGNVISQERINYNKLFSMVLGSRYGLLDEIIWINIILEKSSIENLSRKNSSKSGKEYADNSLLIKQFGDIDSDLNVYINIFKKLLVYLPKLDIINPEELEIESKKEKSTLSQFDINIISNYEKRNKDQIKLLSVYKDIDKIDLRKIELMCDKYGLDYKVIKELLELYFNDHKIVNIINAFVEKYSNYIPYFKNNGNINFIYTSSYANVALSNIDNREDYLKTVTDPFSIVKGNKIEALSKELKLDNTNKKSLLTKHLISFNELNYIPALVPALIYPLNKDLLVWKDINMFYRYVTPDMIEKYLLPETETNKVFNKRNKAYNAELLNVFRLLREKQ